MSELLQTAADNMAFVVSVLLIVAAIFLIAVYVEKLAYKLKGVKQKVLTTRKMAMVGMFSAISAILMFFEFPLPFAPSFYELDFSEIPILVGSFAFGPAAGVLMEFVKILLKLFLKGTSTAFVGDMANFLVGCSFILPASIIYLFKKGKKNAIVACVVATMIITVFGTMFNALYLIPAFSKLYGIPLEVILGMGSKVNPLMSEGSLTSFVICCVAPINLIKGGVASLVTMLVYKPLSPIIKAGLGH